jgi:low affinity Fe/Cu permease
MKHIFRTFATKASNMAGSAIIFLAALTLVITWAVTGPLFNYSNTWQLFINTCTTIVTFLMVFLIQNTQNRDSKALHLKLDELIRSTKGARTYYMGLEDLSDDEIAELDRQFRELSSNPNTTRAIQKLHQKIEAERANRRKLFDFHLKKR